MTGREVSYATSSTCVFKYTLKNILVFGSYFLRNNLVPDVKIKPKETIPYAVFMDHK